MGLVVGLDGAWRLFMPDRPLSRDFREGPTTNNSLVVGFVLAVMIALFLLFGPRMLNSGEKSVEVSKTQPSIESPATGNNKTL